MADLNATKKELEELIDSIGSKVNEYLHSLKQTSSDQIMNGSIPEAQKLLGKILPVEEAYKKLIGCHTEFLKALNEEGSVKASKTVENSAHVDDTELKQIDLSDMEFTPSSVYRVSILKALIYLGGSAKLAEVASFIEKEMKGKFKPADNEKGTNGFGKLWIEMVNSEKENMISEGLISEDKEENQWEIVQPGIDYLAQHSN
ncbi:hypothetical protein MNBD_IGNAVI01-2404 [hydrothermal vent metagenome]|uniref:Uncharacterized protein n=1 Tax=hydrothermal vent metagenome TaxID=652676 RepID=A0A3B1DF14_9ZZZZ